MAFKVTSSSKDDQEQNGYFDQLDYCSGQNWDFLSILKTPVQQSIATLVLKYGCYEKI